MGRLDLPWGRGSAAEATATSASSAAQRQTRMSLSPATSRRSTAVSSQGKDAFLPRLAVDHWLVVEEQDAVLTMLSTSKRSTEAARGADEEAAKATTQQDEEEKAEKGPTGQTKEDTPDPGGWAYHTAVQS